jgi:hypothetical protein
VSCSSEWGEYLIELVEVGSKEVVASDAGNRSDWNLREVIPILILIRIHVAWANLHRWKVPLACQQLG